MVAFSTIASQWLAGMGFSTALLVDSLMVASLAGGLVVGLLLLIPRKSRDCHLHQQLLGYGLMSFLVVGLLCFFLRPGPVGCLSAPCTGTVDQARASDQTQRHFMLAGAGKFAQEKAPHIELAAVSEPVRWMPALLAIWLLGSGICLLRVLRRHLLARRLIRQARTIDGPDVRDLLDHVASRIGLRSPVRLARHHRVPEPAVAGLFSATVFLPEDSDASGQQLEMALVHELAHVRHRHGLISLLAEMVIALFWFHPLVWMAARRLRQVQELVADSEVVRSGVVPSRYAQYLLQSFRTLSGRRPSMATAHSMLGGCLLDSRLRAILDPEPAPAPPSRLASLGLAAGLLILCFGLTFAPASLQAAGVGPQESLASAVALDRSQLNAETLDSILRPVFINKMADYRIAGAAVTVVAEGQLIYRAGFGNKEVFSDEPVDPDRTIFRIGSITKVLTGVAVLQLVDRGLLDLDADVNQYLEDLEVPSTFEEPVRVRHLLTHTAGFDQIGLGRHVTRRDQVRPLRDFLAEYLVRVRPPGTVSCYDTYGITLAGYLVEKVSGLPFDEYLRTQIFEPLGMHRSGILVPPALQTDVATGYVFNGQWRAQPWEFMNTDPASTANATVVDMARFARMMLQGGELDGQRILSPESVGNMLSLQHTNHPDHAGYSFTLWEDRGFGLSAWSHGGSMNGFGSLLYLVPEHKLGIYVAYSQESSGLAGSVISELIPKLFPGLKSSPEMRPRWTRPLDLSRFAGTYANNLYHHSDPSRGWLPRPFELIAEEDHLVFRDSPAYPVGPLSFQLEDGLLLTFEEDGKGEIEHLFLNQTVFERMH